MFLKSLWVFIPEPLIVRHPVPYGPELRRDEAIAAFSTMPLLGHEARIEQGDSAWLDTLINQSLRGMPRKKDGAQSGRALW